MVNQGDEVATYYNQQSRRPPNGYGAGPQMQYYPQPPEPQQNRHLKAPYDPNQPPPYGHQAYQASQAGAGPYTFDQAFKIERPKWNDLWAGILVRPVAPHPLSYDACFTNTGL